MGSAEEAMKFWSGETSLMCKGMGNGVLSKDAF